MRVGCAPQQAALERKPGRLSRFFGAKHEVGHKSMRVKVLLITQQERLQKLIASDDDVAPCPESRCSATNTKSGLRVAQQRVPKVGWREKQAVDSSATLTAAPNDRVFERRL